MRPPPGQVYRARVLQQLDHHACCQSPPKPSLQLPAPDSRPGWPARVCSNQLTWNPLGGVLQCRVPGKFRVQVNSFRNFTRLLHSRYSRHPPAPWHFLPEVLPRCCRHRGWALFGQKRPTTTCKHLPRQPGCLHSRFHRNRGSLLAKKSPATVPAPGSTRAPGDGPG